MATISRPESHHRDAGATGAGYSRELLLLAFEYPPVSGGIARLCMEISGLLQRDHAPARVLTQECAAPVAAFGLPTIRVSSRRPFREWQAYRWLKRQIAKSPEASQATICGVWYPEGLIAYLARVPHLVILAHGAELLPPASRWRRGWWRRLQRRVLESASLVIANSDFTGDLVSKVAPKARVKAIPLAVDTDRFVPGAREAARSRFGVSGKRVLCTVSRLERYKAHDLVFRCIASLDSAQREQLIYLIAGEGKYGTELRMLALELGIESQVRWLGFVPEDELPQVYQASDLFVLCTRESPEEQAVEGFGMVFLEAQASGVPVVGTRTGGISSAVREGEGGWLIEPGDTQALTGIVRQLIRSPESFRAAGLRARQRVLLESTWDIYGRLFLSALEGASPVNRQSETNAVASVSDQDDRGVSIIVPTLNRETYLMDTIRDLLAQQHSRIEILIVDQSNLDDHALLSLIRQNPETISHHKVSFRGLPLARNYGWQNARYDAIVFVDDDIRCGPSLVSEHLRALSLPGVGMVAGGIDECMVAKEEGFEVPGQFNSWTATPHRGFNAMGEQLVQHVPGGNFSVWRSVLQIAGGFDEALAVGAALYEETELCLRVQKCGFDIYFTGKARLQHLAAGNGGCRVADLPKYMGSLAHNRAILIGRNLRWFQKPVAYVRLLLLFVSYAVHHHTLHVFHTGFAGLRAGYRAAKKPPIFSRYPTDVSL